MRLDFFAPFSAEKGVTHVKKSSLLAPYLKVWGLGFGVWGLGFGVWGLGFGVWVLGFGFWGWIWGLERFLEMPTDFTYCFICVPAPNLIISEPSPHTPLPPHQLHISFVEREKCAIFTRTIKDALAHKAMLKYADACFVFVCDLAGNVFLISFL
jgi:hypothetical protein